MFLEKEKANYPRHLTLMNTVFRAWEPGVVVAVPVMKEIEIKLYREVTIICVQYDRAGPL